MCSSDLSAGALELRAPMPGKIVRVLLADGQPVNAHQSVVIMEAMKMQNEIKAPKSGIVKKIHVSDGVAVVSGELLAVIE